MKSHHPTISASTATEPWLPPGRRIHVPRRGSFFVREAAGPPGAPTLVLIHGWMATGGLNWMYAFEPLSKHFRVIAPDLRGHGRGLKTWRRFRLEDCADDVAAIIRRLGGGPAIVAGYSMGGPVSQLVWKRHAPLVAGLVQCATSDRLTPGLAERMTMAGVSMAVAGTTRLGSLPAALPRWLSRRTVSEQLAEDSASLSEFALGELRGHDVRMVMEAGYAISQYDGSSFTGGIEVPSAVVLTLHDRAVLERSQLELAGRLPNARVFPIPDGHVACRTPQFGQRLLEACRDVRARGSRAPRGWRPTPRSESAGDPARSS